MGPRYQTADGQGRSFENERAFGEKRSAPPTYDREQERIRRQPRTPTAPPGGRPNGGSNPYNPANTDWESIGFTTPQDGYGYATVVTHYRNPTTGQTVIAPSSAYRPTTGDWEEYNPNDEVNINREEPRNRSQAPADPAALKRAYKRLGAMEPKSPTPEQQGAQDLKDTYVNEISRATATQGPTPGDAITTEAGQRAGYSMAASNAETAAAQSAADSSLGPADQSKGSAWWMENKTQDIPDWRTMTSFGPDQLIPNGGEYNLGQLFSAAARRRDYYMANPDEDPTVPYGNYMASLLATRK